MKLHLPKGLRAALLAVVTASAALTTTVQAAAEYKADAATYTTQKYYVEENWASYENGTITKLDQNPHGKSNGIPLQDMQNVNLQNWILTIDAYNVLPLNLNEENPGCAYLYGTAEPTIDEDGTIHLNSPNAMSIFITPTGRIMLAATGDTVEKFTMQELGFLDRNWDENNEDPAISLRIILKWDSKDGLTNFEDGGRYGALTMVGIKELSNASDHAIIGDVKSFINNGSEILDNIDLPKHLFGYDDDIPATSHMSMGQVKFTLYHEGATRTDKWVPNATWLVTGRTSINKLADGGFYKDTINKETPTRELGDVEYVNTPDLQNTRTLNDTITFTGTQGAIVLTEAPNATLQSLSDSAVYNPYRTYALHNGDYEHELEASENFDFQLSNTHEVGYQIDPESPNPEVVVGFGAEKDLTMRVDVHVMDNTALSGSACGLSVVGEGTTILEIDNTGHKRLGEQNFQTAYYFREDTPYSIKNTKSLQATLSDFEEMLAEKGINIAGLRIENIYENGELVGHFALVDSDAERYLSFTSTEASEIILSPKGQGAIHLNLNSSNIHHLSSITMVDEAPEKVKETRTVTEAVMIAKLEWGHQDDITPGSPVFDANGNPIYKIKVGDHFENISTGNYTNADFTGEYITINGEVTSEKSPDVQVVYAKDNSQNLIAWTQEELDAGANIYQVMKGDGKTVAFTIALKYKPAETKKLLAVLNDGSPQFENGAYVTEVVTQDVTREVEVWRSWNEHNAIEKTVAETYTIDPGSDSITNKIDYYENRQDYDKGGVDMELELYSSADNVGTICKAGFIENAVEQGEFKIDGRKNIRGLDKYDYDVVIDGILSTLYASGLKTTFTMDIDGNVYLDGNMDGVIDGDITSGYTLSINSGTTAAKNVTVKHDQLFVGVKEYTINEYDPHTATLIVTDTLSLVRLVEETPEEETPGTEITPPEGGTEAPPAPAVLPAPQLYISGGLMVNNLKADNAVYLGTDPAGSYATPEAWLSVCTATTPEIRAPWIDIRTKLTEEQILANGTPTLVSGWTHFYFDKKASVVGSDFHKTVLGKTPDSYSGKRIMYSNHVEENTIIDMVDSDVTVIAQAMDGSDIYLGNSRVNDAAPMLAANLAHDNGGKDKLITVTYTSTVAEGALSATNFTMPEGYTLSAAELDVAGTLYVTASDTTYALTRNAPGADTVYTKVKMTDAFVTAAGTSATSIEADSITLGTGHVLSGATVATNYGMVAGDNTKLINLTLERGNLTTYNDVTIYNMSMKGGMFMTEGDVDFYNTTLANMQSFGGIDGTAFTPAGGDKATITFDGGLTKTGDDAFTLSLTKVTIDASGHDFSTDSEVEVLTSNGDNDISVDDLKSVSYKVQPYTYADYKIENGKLYLVGNKDEERALEALVGNSEVRKETMAALTEALQLTPGGELAALKDAIGMVMESSNETRREILDSISGASITALADSQRRGVQNVQNSLRNRIIQMGGNAEWETSGIQAWGQADGSFSTTKTTDEAPGYDYTTWGATVGANIDLAETVTAGMSLSASYGEIDSDHADKATGNNNAYYVNLFARHQTGRFTQMLILTAGQNDMTLERTVGSYTAEGDTSGSTFSAYYEAGYTLGLNDEFTHIIQPIVSARITSAKVDGYTESGSIGNAALTYDGASCTYGTISAGLRYQGVLYESVYERNAVLETRLMVTSDFGDTTDTAKVALGNGAMREVKGVDTFGTGFDIGMGLSIPMEIQTTLFFDADVNIRPDYTGVSANVGLRYDF